MLQAKLTVIRAVTDGTSSPAAKPFEYECLVEFHDEAKKIMMPCNRVQKLKLSAKRPGPIEGWYYPSTQEFSR
jgi:hypothetical protein